MGGFRVLFNLDTFSSLSIDKIDMIYVEDLINYFQLLFVDHEGLHHASRLQIIPEECWMSECQNVGYQDILLSTGGS